MFSVLNYLQNSTAQIYCLTCTFFPTIHWLLLCCSMQGNFPVSLWKSYLRERGGVINCVLRLYQEVKKKANTSISYLQKVENALWTEKIEYQTPTKVLVYCSKSSKWWGWNLMFEFFITKIFLLAMDEDKDKLCHWDLHVTQASCCSVKAFVLNDMAILIRYEQRNSGNKRKSILQYHLFIKFTCQIYFFFFQLPLDKVI